MANVDVKVSAKISLATIFKKLHEKALSEAEKNGFELANSAVVDNKFQGPGEFFISVKKQDGSEFTADEALPSLQAYVQWFNGPDTAKKIIAQSLIPIENDQEDKSSDKSNDKDDDQEKDDADASDEEKSDDAESDDGESSDNSADDQSTEDSKQKPTRESISYLDSSFRFLLEANDDKEDDDKNAKHPAWGISYKIKEIKGKPFKKLEDSLKDLMKSKLSIKLGWTTLVGSGESYDLGTIELSPEKFFKEVDTDELLKAVVKQADEDFKGNKMRISVDSKDNTLKQLKGIVDKKTKSVIQSTKECMMFKIPKNDKHFKEYTPTTLAKCITKGWESLAKGIGLFKKGGSSLVNMFKSLVKPNEIIRIMQTSNDKSGSQTTEESLIARFYPNLLSEAENNQAKSISDISTKVHNDFSTIESFKKIAGISELPNEKALKISTKIYTDIAEFSSDYEKQFDISKIVFDPDKNEAIVAIKLINISTQSDDIKKYEDATKLLNDALPKDLYQKYKLVADGPVNQIFSNNIEHSEKSPTSESFVIDDRYKSLFSLLFEHNNLIDDDYILTESLIEDDLSEYLTEKKHPISINKKQHRNELIARRRKQLEAANGKDKESEDTEEDNNKEDSVENNTEDTSKDASESSENQTSDNEEPENKEQQSDNNDKDNKDSSKSDEDNDNQEKSNTDDSENDEDVKDNSDDNSEDEDSEESKDSEEDKESEDDKKGKDEDSEDKESEDDKKDEGKDSEESKDSEEDKESEDDKKDEGKDSEDKESEDDKKDEDEESEDDKKGKDEDSEESKDSEEDKESEDDKKGEDKEDGSNDSKEPSVAYILKVSTEEFGSQKLFSDYDVLYLYPIKK